jgi:hypothetical protein
MTTESAWSTNLSDAEWRRVRQQYDDLLGPGELDELFRFVPFMREIRPDALKRYRLCVDTATQGTGLADGMPNPPVASLVSGHFYATLPYPEGVLGDLSVARQIGGTKQEVADIMALAFLHSGPCGMNATAKACDARMREWDSDAGETGVQWPDGWTVDSGAFRCGIDFDRDVESSGLSAEELNMIEAWHLRVQGEVPAYVTFLGKWHPLALRAFRARYETSTAGWLPKEFIALCHVHLAACWTRADALRRTLRMAKYFGVKKDQAVQILSLSMLYLGDIAMDGALEGVDEILDSWE